MTQSPFILAVKAACQAYRWRFSLFGTVLMLVAVGACTLLSDWQFRRAAQKEALIFEWEKRLGAAPLPADALPPGKNGQIFTLAGRFLAGRQFLLDNQVHGGRPGYEVYAPFRLAGGGDVMINRGWLLAPPKRDQLPDVALPSGALRLEARLYRRDGLPPAFGEVAETGRWPVRIQRADLALMAELAELNLRTDGELRLLADQRGALSLRPPIAGLKPEKHFAYALQWLSFAALAFILWLVLSIKRR